MGGKEIDVDGTVSGVLRGGVKVGLSHFLEPVHCAESNTNTS